MTAQLAIALILAAAGAGQDQIPIAGRFEGKIVYGVATDGVDVERLRRDCLDRGGRFDECGSACAPGAICASVCAFTCELTEAPAAHVDALEDAIWVRYVNSDLGFGLEHPASMDVGPIAEGSSGVRFAYERGGHVGPASQPQDGIVITVERSERPPGASLEAIAREQSKQCESVRLGSLEGFSFAAGEPPARTWVLGVPDGRAYWRIRQIYRDPATRGYERVGERMLASFVASIPGAPRD